jgi:hypothetical protein
VTSPTLATRSSSSRCAGPRDPGAHLLGRRRRPRRDCRGRISLRLERLPVRRPRPLWQGRRARRAGLRDPARAARAHAAAARPPAVGRRRVLPADPVPALLRRRRPRTSRATSSPSTSTRGSSTTNSGRRRGWPAPFASAPTSGADPFTATSAACSRSSAPPGSTRRSISCRFPRGRVSPGRAPAEILGVELRSHSRSAVPRCVPDGDGGHPRRPRDRGLALTRH